jgi:DNA-binding NtrC family response regulator
MTQKDKILIIDDKPDMLTFLERLISKELGVDILTAQNSSEALPYLKDNDIDIILLDVRMPGKDGISLLKEIKSLDSDIIVIMLTGYGTVDMAVEALKLGAYDFLTKPVNNERLIHTLRRALQFRKVLKEKQRLEEEIRTQVVRKELIGESPVMKEVLETLRAVAETDETVLILGETGTGKELAARTIHRLSRRADGPFITVNCPAIPESILESELFGYRKGAFTSATSDKKGLIETADHGTIFLDEIGDIPHSVQTKLLRFLQDKEFKPLGDTENIKVDVRVIASTNQDLEKKIQEGHFREDLYYRLNVITIRMPSLKERSEDIPLLAEHFLREYALKYGKEIEGFSDEAIVYLTTRQWKGNVRELQNVIKRAVIFARNNKIGRRDLEDFSHIEPCPDILMDSLLNLDYRSAKSKVLEHFTVNYLRHLLESTKGNVTHAARKAGMERQALQQLMKRYRITSSEFR